MARNHPPRDRRREWSYLKHRKQPSGVLGRPRSPMPIVERRKIARRNYRLKLARRGLRSVRLLLSVADGELLSSTAQSRRLTMGELVADFLHRPRAA